MKRILQIFLFGLLIVLTGCHIDVKNRVKIIGGTYRILTYSYKENDSIRTIRPANKNDTILGLGISFKTTFFADGTEQTALINTHTQGAKGPTDTIENVIVSFKSKEVQNYMYNDTINKNFLMDKKYSIEGSGYIYSKNDSFTTYTFSDIQDFINQYNKREREFVVRRELEREIFFWFPQNNNINYSTLQQLSFKVYFTDGRVIELKPYQKQYYEWDVDTNP